MLSPELPCSELDQSERCRQILPMSETRTNYVPPNTSLTAFNCPHCGALAKQFWFSIYADSLKKDEIPFRPDPKKVSELRFDDSEDEEEHAKLKAWFLKVANGRPFIERGDGYRNYSIQNLSAAQFYNCDDVSIWIHNRLAWPNLGSAPIANVDLPKEVRADYDEAGTLVQLSPRGAAALLRLAIQKLCKILGEKGKSIDDDIASLVKKGLDPRVQQALDVVRVIGNNAVHPGQIDLRDDQSTAEKLFGLVNLIAEIMLAYPVKTYTH
jgi:hypothetical protein